MSERNGMPRPEPIWIALGMVAWAVARALSAERRDRFIDALQMTAAEHEQARRVVAFGPSDGGRRDMRRHARVAGAWVSRLAAELRARR